MAALQESSPYNIKVTASYDGILKLLVNDDIFECKMSKGQTLMFTKKNGGFSVNKVN